MALALFFLQGSASSQVVDKVAAVVNEEVITQSELEAELAPIYLQYRSAYQGEELKEKMEEARRDRLRQMVEDRLVLQEARKAGIEVTDEEIDEKVGQVKAKFTSDSEFMEALREEGLTLKDLKAKYSEQIMVAKIVSRQVAPKVTVSPQEVSDYYTSHLDEFTQPEKVKVSNILIRPEEASEEGWEKARRKGEDLLGKLSEGAEFEQLARDYSQGPNPEDGGDMGYLSRGQMLEAIDEVIFELKVGEVSRLVKTKLGYHIFKVEAKQDERLKEPSEVQGEIEELIFKEKFDHRFKEWMEKLKRNAYISIR